MNDLIPPFVEAAAGEISERLGDRPVIVARISSRRWELAVEAPGIRATIFFIERPSGGWRDAAGTLTVHGKDQPILEPEQLRHLIDGTRNPDNELPLPESIDPADMDAVPQIVRDQAAELSAIIEGMSGDMGLIVGHHGAGYQVVITSTSQDFDVRFYFHKHRNRFHLWAPKGGSIRAIIKGMDLSHHINGDVNKVIALITGQPLDTSRPTPQVIGEHQDAKANTSVLVRRHTVIRV